MSEILTKVLLVAPLDGVEQSGGMTFVHDRALDGDERLEPGARVEVTDGSGRVLAARVVRHTPDGYWQLHIEP